MGRCQAIPPHRMLLGAQRRISLLEQTLQADVDVVARLPRDARLANARILYWSYDAITHSGSWVSCQYLFGHARTLESTLCLERQVGGGGGAGTPPAGREDRRGLK